jgi:hypothetical protein
MQLGRRRRAEYNIEGKLRAKVLVTLSVYCVSVLCTCSCVLAVRVCQLFVWNLAAGTVEDVRV